MILSKKCNAPLKFSRSSPRGILAPIAQRPGLDGRRDLHLDAILVYSIDYFQGLQRITPEWCWRDFCLRLSHGHNHGSEQQPERAVLLWAVYYNFTPAQERLERKRHYRHPGLSPLAVVGFPHKHIAYLDALEV